VSNHVNELDHEASNDSSPSQSAPVDAGPQVTAGSSPPGPQVDGHEVGSASERKPAIAKTHNTLKKLNKRARHCAYCRRRFTRPARGRPAIYCSPSCRQRAYEQRCSARQGPVRLVGADIAAAHNRNEVKRAVAEILREGGLFLRPTPVRRPQLHLVTNDKDGDTDE
jgi:hypothetical protein